MDYRAEIKELREKLNENARLYYTLDASTMSDYEYDRLYRRLHQSVSLQIHLIAVYQMFLRLFKISLRHLQLVQHLSQILCKLVINGVSFKALDLLF